MLIFINHKLVTSKDAGTKPDPLVLLVLPP